MSASSSQMGPARLERHHLGSRLAQLRDELLVLGPLLVQDRLQLVVGDRHHAAARGRPVLLVVAEYLLGQGFLLPL